MNFSSTCCWQSSQKDNSSYDEVTAFYLLVHLMRYGIEWRQVYLSNSIEQLACQSRLHKLVNKLEESLKKSLVEVYNHMAESCESEGMERETMLVLVFTSYIRTLLTADIEDQTLIEKLFDIILVDGTEDMVIEVLVKMISACSE